MSTFRIPDYLQLVADEGTGVELHCGECAINAPGQAAAYWPIAYIGGVSERDVNGLPYFAFNDLDGFIRFGLDHVKTHGESGGS
jgi:hypothetical protein